MPDLYQIKMEQMQLDPLQGPAADAVHPAYNQAKLAELKTLVTLAGDNPAVHNYPQGMLLANAATGNGTSTVHASFGKQFTEDILLRIVTTVGATPTATFNIQTAGPSGSFTNCQYALIATPNTFISSAIVITSAATNVYRVVGRGQGSRLQVVVSANTNVTYTIDVVNFGGTPV
jgi:hypothetical protein